MSKYPTINYIGNKKKLSDWIVETMPLKSGKVLDLFAGGCSISYSLKSKGYSVISNDILFSNYVISKALIENNEVVLSAKIFDGINRDREIDTSEFNVDILKNKLYFENEVQELSKLLTISSALDGYERYMFLALLRRAMIRKLPYSRMNVPWGQIIKLRNEEYSYDKYGRRRAYHNQSFEYHMRSSMDEYNNSVFSNGSACSSYNMDAIKLVDKIDEIDIVYLDPPYPSTMNNYDAFYGLFDQMMGKHILHQDYTKKATFISSMDDLVGSLIGKTKFIVISLNNQTQPAPNEIKSMLTKYGSVKMYEKQHNYQVTGSNNKNNSCELLMIAELKVP
jgi:adenine-specific DNA-methyltransferase